jgi:phospholipid transport system substrate-binding protein
MVKLKRGKVLPVRQGAGQDPHYAARAMSSVLRLLVWLVLVPAAYAQEAPDTLVKRVSEEVLASIRQDKDVRAVVQAKILPHFDARRATQMAVGASWRRATPQQQEQLVREFTTLLVRTYSGALSSYRDQQIEYLPLRAGRADDAEVTVRSRIRQPGAEAIIVEYDLARTDFGWKVYDIRVAGISLVATYRSSFAEEVRNRGIDGLISALAARNRT